MTFVDDGANVLGSEEMQAKAAFLWSLWAFIYGTELNVKADASKSAVSSMRYVRVPGRTVDEKTARRVSVCLCSLQRNSA